MVISMKLDNRLMAIADLVRKDKIFADVGTDQILSSIIYSPAP